MQITIKQMIDYLRSNELEECIWPTPESPNPEPVTYPTIEGNTSNFLTDYRASAFTFDQELRHHFGERVVDLEADNMEDAVDEWFTEMYTILRVYVDAWARLYYALSIDFNPVFNVEEHTVTEYGEHETETELGEREHTEGAKKRTIGAREDTTTDSKWAYDSAAWQNDSKTVDNAGQQIVDDDEYTTNEAAATDTVTSKKHTDKVDRTGNIGVVSATQLLNEEIKLRSRYSFWNNVFTVICEELGAYYECDSLF